MNQQKLPKLEDQEDAFIIEDVQERPELPEHFFRTNSRGLVECIETKTGRVLAVQASQYDLLEEKFDRLVKIMTPQGPVFLEKGLNYDIVKAKKEVAYSKMLADLLCEKIAEGKTLSEAAKEMNIKYSVVSYWRREIPEFKEMLMQAKIDSGEAFHDEAIQTAREKGSAKIQIETLQWAAEKADPQTFGNKKTGEAGGTNIIAIQINTGIRRPGDAGYIEVEAQTALPGPATPLGQEEKVAEKVFDVE